MLRRSTSTPANTPRRMEMPSTRAKNRVPENIACFFLPLRMLARRGGTRMPMFLPHPRPLSRWERGATPASLHLHFRLAHDLAPLLHFVADERAELLGAAR